MPWLVWVKRDIYLALSVFIFSAKSYFIAVIHQPGMLDPHPPAYDTSEISDTSALSAKAQVSPYLIRSAGDDDDR